MKIKHILTLIFFGFLLIQCTNSPKNVSREVEEIEVDSTTQKPSPSAVQRSELAVLMRDLYNETRAYGREELEQQKPFPRDKYEKFLAIKTAKPTDEKNNSDVFRIFADAYLVSLEKLTHPDDVNLVNYNNMVDNCLGCHIKHCPGPMGVINKMKLKED